MARDIVKKDINYISADFSQFRQNLINFAKTYFPNTYNDFNESDPGMLFIEMSSYIGDILSFYLNTQLKEMIFLFSEERRNVINLAQSLGYKPPTAIASSVDLDLFQLLPASGSDAVPDYRYAMTINSGLIVQSSVVPSILFRTQDSIDFSYSSSLDPTEVSVYQIDNDNKPVYYLLKKTRRVVSGNTKIETFTFGTPEKFPKILLSQDDIIEILSVIDSDNNYFYPVRFLAQDTAYEEVPNTSIYDQSLSAYRTTTPYLLRLKRVARRYTTKIRPDNKIELLFGAGISDNEDEIIIPNPDNVGSSLPQGVSVLDSSLDPSNFLYTKTYGLAPSNTTLTVTYSYGGGAISNVPARDLVNIIEFNSGFVGEGLDINLANQIKASLASINPEPATGGRGKFTTEEIKENALAYFSAQDRAVNDLDYSIRIKSMPSKFGYVPKVYVTSDSRYDLKSNFIDGGERLAINIYVLGYDENYNLTTVNAATKQNIKNYLTQYKMLSDGVNLRDGFVINIQVNFDIMVLPNEKEPEKILLKCIDKMKQYFNITYWDFNEPIVIGDVITELAKVKGVQSVTKVEIVNKYNVDDGYSGNLYNIAEATFNNIIYPSLDPSIFEVKYPNTDIKGRITTV